MCVAMGGGSAGGNTDPNYVGNAGGAYQGMFSSTDSNQFFMPPGSTPGANPIPAQPFSSGDFRSTAVTPAPATAAKVETPAPPTTAVTPTPTPTTPIPPMMPRQPTVDEPQDSVARWGERYYRSKTARGEGSVARFGSTGNYKSKLGSASA